MSTDLMPAFEDVVEALHLLNATTDASEAHGLLCALFCGGAAVSENAWIDSMATLDDKSKANEDIAAARETLLQLHRKTAYFFKADNFDFMLLLPDDDSPFPPRIEALSYWCQGFLTGLNLIGISVNSKDYEGELAEAFEDLSNMSLLRYDDEEMGDEEVETAYSELVEYARVAVLLLHVELTKKQKASAHDGNNTVH